MDTQEGLLSFLDLLDLDEEIIDKRLKSIMVRNNHSNKHLASALQLLQYKNLINTQENSDCENDDEFDFTVQLLRNVNHENVDYVCKIINIVLCLNANNIINKSEHLIQQILLNMDFQTEKSDSNESDSETSSTTLINLKICGSILDAIIQKNEKLSLPFLETPLENILLSTDENLKIYFLTSTVPRIFEAVIGYNILDRIWNYIKQLKAEYKENALKILSCLADYYLPIPDNTGTIKYESEIILFYDFWEIILFGIKSMDTAIRKISIYLSKRAIDCVIHTKKDICIKSETDVIFSWNIKKSKAIKSIWDNYFVLIDSLDEKQSNIVLPSLKLFDTLYIEECWRNAAFNIGLKHDNTQVRLKCIDYKLKTKIMSQSEAAAVLEVFNDINIYTHNTNYEAFKCNMIKHLKDNKSFFEILKAIPTVKWSPVPFYHITHVLSDLDIKVANNITDMMINILKVPCNNIVIRKASHMHIAHFLKKCCCNLDHRDIININSLLQLEPGINNPLHSVVQLVKLKNEEILNWFRTLSENIANIDIIITYISNNDDYLNIFIDVITEKITKLNETVNRQYAEKRECFQEIIFLIHFLSKTRDKSNSMGYHLHEIIARHNKTILQCILSLFSSDSSIPIKHIAALLDTHNYEFKDEGLEDILLQLYKTSILFLKENSELDKAVLSIFTIKKLHKNPILINKYKHELLNLKRFLAMIENLKLNDSQNESVGRSKNIYYEKSCEVIHLLIEEESDTDPCINELITYLENVLECGGYGCLRWILKTINKIIKSLTNDKIKFNMVQFINRAWNEIEELKSSNQYSPSIEEFVELITQDALLEKAMYNNIVVMYCNKIIEQGPVKTHPLYYLTRKIYRKGVKSYGHLVYILCEVLLYCPVPRKDQRITDYVTMQILFDSTYYGIDKDSVDIHFNFEIQYLAIATLCHINDADTLNVITKFITQKIDDTFRNKLRYHGNSQLHKMLLAALQHILIIVLKSTSNLDWLLKWCLDLLRKLPHQPSARICFEWLLALFIYIKKIIVNEDMFKILISENVPLTSIFYIVYWIIKHKITNGTYTETEYNIVQDFLLSHTMGQLFNVRLHAQYLSLELHKLIKKSSKYDYTISVIEKTFEDNASDKNYMKLKNDYFTNKFDIVADLNPFFIYYSLPRLIDDNNEDVNLIFVTNIMEEIDKDLVNVADDFILEWKTNRRADEEYMKLVSNKLIDKESVEDGEWIGTIQKKYIPWKHMSDVNVYEVGKKSESPSDLIVVASLIDKLPNLGGMARTSEVFGVKTYVVDSLRHLQDKQFQGLSVSAERWINIKEVRPGQALKEYLLQQKAEGYSIVAAEQTSSSSKLQTFKFPKKTLLLLGHEKLGVPCDLLPLMDYCVEIPQQGYVRSLNVHVTAAIFVWEYARQNVL